VTFTESGLPSGTSWCVKVGSTSRCSSTATIAFSLGNGTYRYQVGAVTGYFSPAMFPATVKAVGGAAVAVKFFERHPSPTLYVPFLERDL